MLFNSCYKYYILLLLFRNRSRAIYSKNCYKRTHSSKLKHFILIYYNATIHMDCFSRPRQKYCLSYFYDYRHNISSDLNVVCLAPIRVCVCAGQQYTLLLIAVTYDIPTHKITSHVYKYGIVSAIQHSKFAIISSDNFLLFNLSSELIDL